MLSLIRNRRIIFLAFFVIFVTFIQVEVVHSVTFSNETYIGSDDLSYEEQDIVIDGCVVTVDGEHSFLNLSVVNAGKITHSSGTQGFHLNITGDLTIDAGGSLSANGQGYSSDEGPGAGEQGSGSGNGSGGGGAGYGGIGGDGYGSTGGSTYGSITEPIDLGSGGGYEPYYQGYSGGSGGGAIRLNVLGTLTVNGELTSNGNNGGSYYNFGAGGGSGGSIWLTVGTLAGNGTISANGGNANGSWGGGGGGGRIAFYFDEYTFSGSINVLGGSGYQSGKNGSIYTTPNEEPLQLNRHTIGHIDTPYSIQYWHFSALANQLIRLKDVTKSSPGVVFGLIGPNGWIGFEALEGDSELIILPTSGYYTLTAHGTGGSYHDVFYSFFLENVTVTDLSIFSVYNGEFIGSGQAQLYRIEILEGKPLRVKLDDSADVNYNEIYIKFGSPPTRGDYDFRFTNLASSDQTVSTSMAMPGIWYILVYADNVVEFSNFTLVAETSNVFLYSVTPDHHTINANTTIMLAGAGFKKGIQVDLIGSDQTHYQAETIEIDSLTQLRVTYSAGNVPVGIYSVEISELGGDSDLLVDAFEFTDGIGTNLETNLIVPSRVGYHTVATIWVEYANTGDAPMSAPLLVVTASQRGRQAAIMKLTGALPPRGFWTSAMPEGFSNTIQLLATGNTPGILQPGESFRVPIQFAGWQKPWDFRYPPISFSLGVLDAANDTPVDWNSLKAQMRPSSFSEEIWEPIWSNFISQAGVTWGDYVTMLTGNALYLGRLGLKVTDIGELLSFEFAQADGLNIVRSLAASTAAFAETPGSDVIISRVFPQTISGRSAIGAFGRGWFHNWQANLSVAVDGTVAVLEANGSNRIFQPDSRPGGGYFPIEGDHATLINLGNGAFTLQEVDGTLRAFRSDGRLVYFEDTNNNRITVGYTEGRITSLVHSSGQSLQLTYNADGFIDSIADQIGRETNYSYDVTGEHLISVTNFDGSTVSYSYHSGSDFQREHALTEIQFPGGNHQYFAYDDRGRLSSIMRDEGLETTLFSYDNAGMVIVTNAIGNSFLYYLDQNGLLRRAKNSLGNAVAFEYNENYDLVQITDPNGHAHHFGHDDMGNIIIMSDPLGNDTRFTFTSPFNRITELTDAKGNVTKYGYDANGNLTSITYDDASIESWTYNENGNPSSWTNRRGNTIDYAYNSVGRLTSKTYPDESQIEYIYDTRGNLTTAIDTDGTTTLQYDENDRLARIIYPGGRFLQYSYNAAGQRASMVDQLGYRLDYHYDATERLGSITDETSTEIVRYHYDPAGRIERKELGNGVYTDYQHDSAGQLTSLSNHKPDDTILSLFVYNYDEQGRRTSMTTTYGDGDTRLAGVWDYDYDELGQLTGLTAPDGRRVDYDYDPLGNRITVTDDGVVTNYITNNMNQYTHVGDETFEYDEDGNLIQKNLTEGSTYYTFNIENRLTALSSPNGNWEYTYNAFGNRVAVIGNSKDIDIVIDPIGYGDPVGGYDHLNGNLIVSYFHGYSLVSRGNSNRTPSFYTFDASANTVELTDNHGETNNSYAYFPFGEIISESESLENSFKYVGEYSVSNELNNLFYMKNRHYNAELGRFLSPDPLNCFGGDFNLYRYVINQPTYYIDPMGLKSWDPGIIDPNKYGNEDYWTQRQYENDHFTPGPHGFPSEADYYDYIDDAGDPCKSCSQRMSDCWACIGQWNPFTFSPSAPFLDPAPLPRFQPPNPPPGSEQSGSSDSAGAGDPNEKIGTVGYGDQGFISGWTLLPYRVNFENETSATAPAQIVTVTDLLDSDLDWTTFMLTGIGFGDERITIPENIQYFETTIPMSYNGVNFEVQIEAGIHLSSGEVYACFYSIDPSTGLPTTVDTGFLPPEDGTGRGQGYFTYVIKPKADLPEGTEIRNVANITFDFQESIATNQVDPHDPTQGTDPNKECLNTIAPDLVNLTISSTDGGSVTMPGSGTFSYPWANTIELKASPNSGYRFIQWTGDTAGIEDVTATETNIIVYDNFTINAVFSEGVPKVIYVDSLAAGANDGTSWSDAYTVLTTALSDAEHGDEIWVVQGIYTPGLNRTDAFTMKNGVAIYGGFEGTEIVREDRNWNVNTTILSGDIGVIGDTSDNCYHVLYHPDGTNLNNSGILDGFIISGGNADGNDTDYYGGAMYNFSSSPTVTHCKFEYNSAGAGGAIYNDEYSAPIFSNTIFSHNEATDNGFGGGAVYSDNMSYLQMINCTLTQNIAETGGALYNNDSATLIINSILWKNITTNDPEIHSDNSFTIIEYSNIDQDGYEGENENIRQDPLFVVKENGDYYLAEESPCIDSGDPVEWLFDDYLGGLQLEVDAVTGIYAGDQIWITDAVNFESDYVSSLSDTLINIDTGFLNTYLVSDFSYVFTNYSDYAKEPDPNGSRINMGAYGGTSEATISVEKIPGDIDGDGDVDGNDLYRLAAMFNTMGCGGCPEDLNSDDNVNSEDLTIFSQAYGMPY